MQQTAFAFKLFFTPWDALLVHHMLRRLSQSGGGARLKRRCRPSLLRFYYVCVRTFYARVRKKKLSLPRSMKMHFGCRKNKKGEEREREREREGGKKKGRKEPLRRDSKTRSLRADYGRSKGRRGKCETYTARRTVVQKLNENEAIVVSRKNGSKWSFSSSGQTRGKFAYQRNLAIMNKKREERLKGPLLLLYRDRLRR